MKDSTTTHKPVKKWESLLAVFGWLVIWYVASRIVGQEMLLASPISVTERLLELIVTTKFWVSVFFSLSRVALGFMLALVVGIILAVMAWKVRAAAVFLKPFIGVVKAAPVASYVIICLLLLPSRNLSVVISFLMALPILYTNMLEGLCSMDTNLLEMAEVFQVPVLRRAIYLYFPQLMPFLLSACSLSLGLCWKSGIAAEVIGLPLGSIGENLYQAKIFADTKTVLAWTMVVILISVLTERIFLWLLRCVAMLVERK